MAGDQEASLPEHSRRTHGPIVEATNWRIIIGIDITNHGLMKEMIASVGMARVGRHVSTLEQIVDYSWSPVDIMLYLCYDLEHDYEIA